MSAASSDDLEVLLLNSVSRRGIDGEEEKTREETEKEKVEKARLMCEEGGQELSPCVT